MLPVMIGTENEVPCFNSQVKEFKLRLKMFSPGRSRSGFGTPKPSSNEFFVMPLELKYATSSRDEESDPTPITVGMSPGFSALPGVGPSFPIAETIMTPAAVNSFILSINGTS